MNSKTSFLMSLLLFVTYTKITAIPLTLINSTVDTVVFNVELSNETKKVAIKSIDKWTHELDNQTFVSVKWSAYSEKLKSYCNYTIDINEIMPTIAQGGSLVILNDGGFIYDPKQGRYYPGTVDCTQ